jgi:23S rRNA (guanine745-N1)-methyltransferase
MLHARRRFLDADWYAPLAEAVAAAVSAWLAEDGAAIPPEARALLDAGCGEGYYLRRLAATQAPTFLANGWRLYGLDLAKDAIRMAAGRAAVLAAALAPTPTVTWLVASSKDRLPFADAGVGALLTIFAPRHAEEFARVVAPGGLLLVVTPTGDHLAQARAAIPWLLTPDAAKDERLRATLEADFALMEARTVSFTLALDATALADLVEMTPHRPVEAPTLAATTRAVAALAPGGRLTVGAACIVRRYRRRRSARD